LSYYAHPEAVKQAQMHPKVAPVGEIRDAIDYRRQFPDGRIGSDPSLASVEDGKRLFEVAVEDVAEDYAAFLAGGCFVPTIRTVAVSTDIPGPISRAYFSQRLRLHYVDWGNPEKPPLLLIHGGRDHCRNWDWVAQRLRHDWHIIAPDLRGHGDSEWIKGGVYTMSDYVCDIAQLVHQLELKPLTIIGHSLGGAITLRYTGLFPETVVKAVAIEGLGWSPDKIAEHAKIPTHERITKWMADMRRLSGRIPRRYTT